MSKQARFSTSFSSIINNKQVRGGGADAPHRISFKDISSFVVTLMYLFILPKQ